MDLRKLKNYLKYQYRETEENCYYIGNDYVITDSYSIILLNDNNGLNIVNSEENNIYKRLKVYKEEFTNKSKPIREIQTDFKEECYKIDDNYSIALKNMKEIKNLIKANKFEILETNNLSSKYIIKLTNTKTCETGFLLPCRTY